MKDEAMCTILLHWQMNQQCCRADESTTRSDFMEDDCLSVYFLTPPPPSLINKSINQISSLKLDGAGWVALPVTTTTSQVSWKNKYDRLASHSLLAPWGWSLVGQRGKPGKYLRETSGAPSSQSPTTCRRAFERWDRRGAQVSVVATTQHS